MQVSPGAVLRSFACTFSAVAWGPSILSSLPWLSPSTNWWHCFHPPILSAFAMLGVAGGDFLQGMKISACPVRTTPARMLPANLPVLSFCMLTCPSLHQLPYIPNQSFFVSLSMVPCCDWIVHYLSALRLTLIERASLHAGRNCA
jgi:hypothetical protein